MDRILVVGVFIDVSKRLAITRAKISTLVHFFKLVFLKLFNLKNFNWGFITYFYFSQ